MAKILVIRFSALGDVAMTIPVVYSFAKEYPQHQITVLSREGMRPLFEESPVNVKFEGVDLKDKYKGFIGIFRLYSYLKKQDFDYIADLHNVLRSKVLRFCFLLSGKKIASINKGKNGKRRLVRRHNKIFKRQPSSFDNYANVLRSLGFPFQFNFISIFGKEKGNLSSIVDITGDKANQKWIGIAPFAKHAGKIYPKESLEKVIAYFSEKQNIKIFLFGGGKSEYEIFEKWIKTYSNIIPTMGKMNMHTELILMSYLDVMLSMDSANMHLASLVNTPVVSVWGATHPYCGFMGWGQSDVNLVQVELPCRPCSVFGNKPCYRQDNACMTHIIPEMIINKIEKVIAVQ